jgi:hypothetical protein
MQGTLGSTSLHRHDLQMQASAFRKSYLMKPGQELPCTDGDQCHGNTLIARVSLQRVSRVGEVRGCICTSHFTFCKRKQATSSLVPHDPTPTRSPSTEARTAHVLKGCRDTYYLRTAQRRQVCGAKTSAQNDHGRRGNTILRHGTILDCILLHTEHASLRVACLSHKSQLTSMVQLRTQVTHPPLKSSSETSSSPLRPLGYIRLNCVTIRSLNRQA